MRTARSSSRWGGLTSSPSTSPRVWTWTRSPSTSPLGVGLDQIPLNFGVGLDQIPLNFPLGCWPGPDPPQLPPCLWAWTRSPSTSPLVVGLEDSPRDQAHTRGTRHPPPPRPWIEFLTQASENITLPQTSFAGGNEARTVDKRAVGVPLGMLSCYNKWVNTTYFLFFTWI